MSICQYSISEFAIIFVNQKRGLQKMNYAERIRSLREDKDLRQIDVATILKKSQQGYAHLENEEARLSVEDLRALCEYYNVTADYILGFTDTPSPLPKKK